MKTRIRSILFDFGGTLDSNGIHWPEHFFRIYREEGLKIERKTFDRAFYDSDDNLPSRFHLPGLNLEETIRLQVGCVLDSLHISRNPHLEHITRKFVASSRKAFAENIHTLKHLHANRSLGIVSNFYGNMASILEGEGLSEMFGAIADSHVVGVMKPDEKIFRYATKRLGIAPEEALMVGDSLHRDMKGAEKIGMPHAWMAGERPDSDVCCKKALILRSLSDLKTLFPMQPLRA